MVEQAIADLSSYVSDGLTVDALAPLSDNELVDADRMASEQQNSVFTKIRFRWRPDDRAILDRINLSAQSLVQSTFADAVAIIDGFYATLRVPELTDHGTVRLDADGRPVWRRDDAGVIIERWDQLCGQDIEEALLRLQRLKMAMSPKINRLLNDAIYARHVASDAYDDAWGTLMDGTQGDRAAASNRESRQEKYHAYFRYVAWSEANTLAKELSEFMRLLEKIRGWNVYGGSR